VLSDYTSIAPTPVREPFHRGGWVYEEKVDGAQSQAICRSSSRRRTIPQSLLVRADEIIQ
jgi:hypothetical protein